jgi:hypothetical protein
LEEQGLRPSDHTYYQVDATKKEQWIMIGRPEGFDGDASFIVFSNDSNLGGVSLLSHAGVLPCLYPGSGKRNVNVGETVVYGIGPGGSDNLRIIPADKSLGSFRVRPSFVYEFLFDGDSVQLIDARPLHRVGEPSWSRETPVPLFPIAEPKDGPSLAALAGNRLTWYTLDRDGNLEERESFGINENTYVDPRTMVTLEPGRFIAAGAIDSLAGAFIDPAYTAWFGELGVSPRWETDLDRFETESLSRYGPVRSLSRDTERDLYRYCGELISWDAWDSEGAMPGTYAGSFRLVEGTALFEEAPAIFEGCSFTQICCAGDGGFYLAGKRQVNGRMVALLRRYNPEGRQHWEVSPPLPGNSWYQCAVIEEEDGRIMLAGTLGASDPTGKGGRPFIQALALEDGAVQWLQILDEDVFRDMNLVTSIAGAHEYGYLIGLAGTGGEAGPYMTARLNAAGRYMK